ncbi:rod-binding protein [Polycladidibacter hongkongensis]|uniref:rod-binding protein n=1 Tax=Polycladidibacter hongkongensis TaxID=1647556 RepID=UPI000833AE07|nr:rod-binding protein [Pseudovibrio hongkongensis]
MAIQPVSDLVLDVLRQADPLASRTATTALSRPAKVSADLPLVASNGAHQPLQQDFTAILGEAEAAGEARKAEEAEQRPPLSSVAAGGLPLAGNAGDTLTAMKSVTARVESQHKLGEKLEAAIMQTFVQSMLPKSLETVYGGGTAGEMWKSMMAEQLAGQLAKSGSLGLAEVLIPENLRNPAENKEA